MPWEVYNMAMKSFWVDFDQVMVIGKAISPIGTERNETVCVGPKVLSITSPLKLYEVDELEKNSELN